MNIKYIRQVILSRSVKSSADGKPVCAGKTACVLFHQLEAMFPPYDLRPFGEPHRTYREKSADKYLF